MDQGGGNGRREAVVGGHVSHELPYTVVECSSEDPEHPVNELYEVSAQSRGWQSAKFAPFPQELTLVVDGLVFVEELQVLCHQFKIPSKVDVFISTATVTSKDSADASYTRLGHFSLDPNAKSRFRARELKTVYLRSTMSRLRLRLHQCHGNDLNICSQVGFLAVRVFGYSLDALGTGAEAFPGTKEERMPMDEGDRTAAVDAATSHILANLQDAKQRAIDREDYDEAKRIKALVADIRVAGQRIAALESLKTAAVRREAFDEAKSLKIQVDDLRQRVSALAGRPVEEPGYVTDEGVVASERAELTAAVQVASDRPESGSRRLASVAVAQPAEAQPSAMASDPQAAVPIASPRGTEPVRISPEGAPGSPPALARRGSPERARSPREVAPPGPRRTVLQSEYDERSLPPKAEAKYDFEEALAKEALAEQQNPSSARGGGGRLPEPEALPKTMETEAEPFVEAFGDHIARCFFSSQWTLRQAAVDLMKQALVAGGGPGDSARLAVSFKALRRMASDKIAQVRCPPLAWNACTAPLSPPAPGPGDAGFPLLARSVAGVAAAKQARGFPFTARQPGARVAGKARRLQRSRTGGGGGMPHHLLPIEAGCHRGARCAGSGASPQGE